jgi:hypothetical protein
MPPSTPHAVQARRLPLAGATLTLALCVSAPIALYAQGAPGAAQPAAQTGRVVGRVVDAATGAGLSDVQVRVEGTALGALSAVDGRFVIAGVPAGRRPSRRGASASRRRPVTGVVVRAGRAVEQNLTLAGASVQLQQVTVTAAVERGTVNQALDAQRTAVGVVNAVTSEQIARSPDGDAAQAVQRVSGVTVQDGRYVFVRGLGERYTTTSLNGARLPSPEPERKVVPLDLFPTGLIQTITTSKTFTPDLSGDFSGAQVDIRTREFPARRTISYSTSTGYNTAARGDLPAAPGVGGEGFAYARTSRFLPALARATPDLGGTSQGDKNTVINQFRNVWQADPRGGRPTARSARRWAATTRCSATAWATCSRAPTATRSTCAPTSRAPWRAPAT